VGRFAFLAWLAIVFLGINAAVRVGLVAWEATRGARPDALIQVLLLGTAFDVVALAWALVPFALLGLACGSGLRGRRVHAWVGTIVAAIAVGGMVFVALAEMLFWNEFSARFNFIAVDYLVYTREVVGNIRESYPLPALLAAVAVIAAGIVALGHRRLVAAAGGPAVRWRGRVAVAAGLAACAVGVTLLPLDERRERLADAGARELAGNGYHDFFRALRNNDLDYGRFYAMLEPAELTRVLHHALAVPPKTGPVLAPAASVGPGGASGDRRGGRHIERPVIPSGPVRPMHVVLVSIESLGADYVESLGGRPALTPNLDRLGREGLLFTRLYATGLRTVRGLEALTLSMPPTPGHAVPMRRNVPPLQSLGSVLREHGYESLYVYGGYAIFDNMRSFFEGNGYEVVDRSAVPSAEIVHENIWGVADEHLFAQAIREMDVRTRDGRKVFAHVMTTSNHRPFTYPDGRIDIPSGSGRDGAVKYTDWAIGTFLREASTRPWFADTLFVLVADHTSNGRGRTDLPPVNYHIPMVFYAPKHIVPGRLEHLASQIDVAPTVLGFLGLPYQSQFFGHDLFGADAARGRALLSNYLTVGYYRDDVVVELGPKQRVRVLSATDGRVLPAEHPGAADHVREAIAYYQSASSILRIPTAAY